jgi:hypothetical protein
MGCVLTINMEDKDNKPNPQHSSHLKPINIVNLQTNDFEPHCEEEEKMFDQNTVPFDFDGDYLLWLRY